MEINIFNFLPNILFRSVLKWVLLFLIPYHTYGQGKTFSEPIELGYITSSLSQEYLMSYYFNGYNNVYGSSPEDIIHRFTVTGTSSLSISYPSPAPGKFYILDNEMNETFSHNVTVPNSWTPIEVTLGPGTYFFVLEAGTVNQSTEAVLSISFYVNDNSGVIAPTEGINKDQPIVVPTELDGTINFSIKGSFDPVLGYGNNFYATSYHDVYYSFILTEKAELTIAKKPDVYFNGDYSVFLLDENGSTISSINSSTSLLQEELEAGRYFFVIEGEAIGMGYNYSVTLTSKLRSNQGTGREDAILIGNYQLGGEYSYHDNRYNLPVFGYGNNMGQPSDEIFYKLVLGKNADLSASLCGSDFDTFIYLLNSSGSVIHQNNDNGPLCNGIQSSLKVNNLAAGVYYLVVEGNGTAAGNINLYVLTEVQGSQVVSPDFRPITLSQNQNYISVQTLLVDSIMSEAALSQLARKDYTMDVSYYDGLGRMLQKIGVGLSPLGQDIVTPIDYDPFGRENKQYLPYEAQSIGTQGSGYFRTDALSGSSTEGEQALFYKGDHTTISKMDNPYIEYVLESSPLNRLRETAQPGNEWKRGLTRTVEHQYEFNGTDEVRLWQVNTGTNGGAFTNSNFYPAGTLYKNTVRDENGSLSIEYKDKEGTVVCMKVQSDEVAGNPVFLTTDYIYDTFGDLRYVVPPALSSLSSFAESGADFNNYIYAYKYDGHGRQTGLKVPGSGWEYTVYNSSDRAILTQNAEQRERVGGSVWSFMKYDRLGRLVIAGEIVLSESRESLQNLVDALQLPTGSVPLFESRSDTETFGYTDHNYPSHSGSSSSIFTVHYYDDYSFLDLSMIQTKPHSVHFRVPDGSRYESLRVRGFETGSLTRILGTASFLVSEILYDTDGRVSEVIEEHHLGGADKFKRRYNFTGSPISELREHFISGRPKISIAKGYTYDHGGRVTSISEQIDNSPAVVTQNTYDALGTLAMKSVGGNPFSYRYNARGWLSKASSPLFNLSLSYERATGYVRSDFTGNIVEQVWTTGDADIAYRYSYSYDRASRLLSGVSGDGYGETLTYDELGNITSLTRTGTFSLPDVSGSFSYDYGSSGSRLHSVTNGLGYSRQYVYSSAGSMSSDGLVQYAYNELGLPKSVTGSAHMSDISYLYDSRGRKLSYVSGLGVRDYVNGIEYLGSDLDFIHMSNGISRRAGSGYSYSFFLKDHLGSIRLVHDASGSVVQQTDYLPFGLEVPRKISSPKLDYSYNGKEFQSGINKYDYGARLYDPVIGRWNVVDPLAEVQPNKTPYHFVSNNPINRIDPDGRWDDWVQNADGEIYWDKNATSQATTKAGETYLGRDLIFTFNSYIDNTFDGPNPPWGAEGDKLTSTISIKSRTDSENNLLGVDVTSSYDVKETGGLSIFKGRDYFPGLGDDQNKSINIKNGSNFSAIFEQHASVPGLEAAGLAMLGYSAVNVAQKATIGLSGNNLSISAFTDVFPSATLFVNGHKLFQYNQPSFKATHGNKVIDFGSPTRAPGTTGRPTPNFYMRYNK